MKRPLLKSASKRTSVRLREKIKKKVAEHGRKTRKLQKSQKTKKQTVPQNAPFKDEILNAAAEFQEIKRAKVTAKKLAKKENKIKMKGKSISDIMKNVQKAHSSFDKKQVRTSDTFLTFFSYVVFLTEQDKFERMSPSNIQGKTLKKQIFDT